MEKRILMMFLAFAIAMTGCSVQQRTSSENSGSSDSNDSILSSSSSADPSDKKENTEKISVEIPRYTATLDQSGNLEIDYGSPSYAHLDWAQPDGYSITNESEKPDFTPPGIQNKESFLILDLLQLIHCDAINLIEYQNNLPARLDIFHHAGSSNRYDYFLSAMPYDGSGWQKNQNESSDFGYLLDVWVEMDGQNYLRFHFYFKGNQKYNSYESLPEKVRNQLISIIDSFEI